MWYPGSGPAAAGLGPVVPVLAEAGYRSRRFPRRCRTSHREAGLGLGRVTKVLDGAANAPYPDDSGVPCILPTLRVCSMVAVLRRRASLVVVA